jgi:hypothetical protein
LIGDNDGWLDFSCSSSVWPFCLRIFVSGSIGSGVISVSESLRFVDDNDDSMVEFIGMESIIYKLALFFVAFVISLH